MRTQRKALNRPATLSHIGQNAGRGGVPDLAVWKTHLEMNGDEDLILGTDGKTDRHSFLRKAFRYSLEILVTVTVTATVQK